MIRRAGLAVPVAVRAVAVAVPGLLAIVTVTLLAGLTAGAQAAGAQAAGAQAAAAARPVRGLVFRGASSPVLRDLRSDLGARLSLTPETPARLSRDHGYGVLVLDGDTITPAALAADRTQLRAYLDSGGWVLALDVDPADFSRAINGLTGFTARPPHGTQSSRAFLFRDTTLKGIPAVVMLDAPSLTPLNANQLSPNARRAATAAQAQRIAALIRTRLLNPNSGLQTPARERVTGAGDESLPQEALHKMWVLTGQESAVPPAAYWTLNRDRAPAGITPPTPGQQTVSWTVNQEFDAYLDNSATHPQGDFQVVTYDLSAQFTPKAPNQKFQYMDDPFKVGLGTIPLERAWWTGIVDQSVDPDPGSNTKLIWQASNPATPNEESSYTSGQRFEIGFSASKDGPGISSSYTVSNEQAHTVPDWGVANETAGNDLEWEFSARHNCDIRLATYTDTGCFNWGALQDGAPFRPNELSLGNLGVAASGRWRTKQLLTAGQGKLTFKVDTSVTLADTVCEIWQFGTCDRRFAPGRRTFLTGPGVTDYTIDASDVVPVGIASLSVTPNPADGTKNQPVTGTVSLKAPAPVQTVVKLFSDDSNATLPIPLGHGVSEGTLTIGQGKSSGTFAINTNDNGLEPGEVETAAITSFYTEPVTIQLRVKATT
jgi:hypothetical protein